MKRIKVLAGCCLAAACFVFMLSGCSSGQPYEPSRSASTVTTPALGKEGTLRVGVNANSAPFAATSTSTSKIVGIDVDVAAALADSMGLKLEVVDTGSDPDSALKDGKVDVVMGINKSDTTTTFWISDEYLPTGVALFAASGTTAVPTKGSNPKIAAQAPSKSTWPITNQFGEDSLVPESDLKVAFSDLSSGSAQYVAADLVIGMYAAYSEGFDAAPIAFVQQPSGYCVGVLDSNSILKQAVSDAVSSLTTNGMVSIIEKKWLSKAIDASVLPLTDKSKSSSSSK